MLSLKYVFNWFFMTLEFNIQAISWTFSRVRFCFSRILHFDMNEIYINITITTAEA